MMKKKKGGESTIALAGIKPAAEMEFNSFREMNAPDVIGMEFSIKFTVKAWTVFASTDGEAMLKLPLEMDEPQ